MCDPDPRDEIMWSARALRAISDLVNEAGAGKAQFSLVGPQELGELLGMVEERLRPAADAIGNYQPRD